MRRDPLAHFIAHTPAGDAALSAEDIAQEIARLAGLLAHRIGVRQAFAALMRIAGALGTGGRA